MIKHQLRCLHYQAQAIQRQRFRVRHIAGSTNRLDFSSGNELWVADNGYMYCIYHKMICWMIVGLLAFGLATEGAAQVRRSFDAEKYFKSLDRNGDEKLEKNELNPRALAYLKKIGAKVGDDKISLRSITKIIAKNKKSSDEQAAQQKLQKNGQTLKVPGFGVPEKEYSVDSFGTGDGAQENNFSEETIARVDSVLRRYDRNGDNIIDKDERRRARWGRPDPSESDLNQDGLLTRFELMKRYQVREQEQERHQDNSRSERGRRRSSDDNERSSRNRSRASGRSSTTNASSRSKTLPPGRDSAAYDKYAKSLIKRYDKDNDNRLSKEEWKKVRRPPENADQNRDGFVTQQEYAKALKAVADKRPGASPADKSSSATYGKKLANVKASSGGKGKSASKSKSKSCLLYTSPSPRDRG